MKIKYEEPIVELFYLEKTDVITLSNGDDTIEGGDFPNLPTT